MKTKYNLLFNQIIDKRTKNPIVFATIQIKKKNLFIDKKIPLSKNKVLNIQNNDIYWINTPLKKTKDENSIVDKSYR